jgi:nucleotide-binding universal stress UspA family protein
MNNAVSPINDMHVIVDLSGERRPAVIAADLARLLDAHLTGVALAFEPVVPVYTMTTPLPTDLIVAAHEQAVSDAKQAAAAFERIAAASGVRYASRTTESVGGDGLEGVTRSLAMSDLLVVGQQNPDAPEPMREALIEAMLFQSGAPILIVPYTGVSTFTPGRAIIAWDGGAAAAHAVRAAMPLLHLAKEVVVVLVKENIKRATELAGADIATHLARHNLNVEVREITNATGDIGQTILSFAADEAADWMVMGGYGHSRMREFFLGGATRGILESMTLPVLMAH